MTLFYDLGISSFVIAPLNRGVVSSISLTRGDTSPIAIIFCRDGNIIELGSSASAKFDIKLPSQFSGETPLASATYWVKTGTGINSVYSFSPSLNTETLNQALVSGTISGSAENQTARFSITELENGNIIYQADSGISWTVIDAAATGTDAGWHRTPQLSAVSLLAEIQITEGESVTTLSRLSVNLSNDLIKGDEGTPVYVPDMKASQAEAEAGTDNSRWMTPLRTAEAIAAQEAAALPAPLSQIAALTPNNGDIIIREMGSWVSTPASSLGGGGIPDAPSDGQTWGRANGEWRAINPQNITLPTITGTATAGMILSDGGTDTWTGNPTSFLRQWQRGSGSSWSNISGATGSSYALVYADIGYQIRMLKSAINSFGQSLPFSEASPTSAVDSLTLLDNIVTANLLNGDVSDATGNGNALLMVNVVPFVADPDSGLTNQVAYFDGTAANFFDTLLSVSGPWSWRGRFWIVSGGDPSMVVSLINPTCPPGNSAWGGTVLSFDAYPSRPRFQNASAGGDTPIPSGFVTGAWMEVTVVNDPSLGLQVYIDGTHVISNAGTASRDFTRFVLGGAASDGPWAGSQGIGYMKDFIIWNRIISDVEAAALVGLPFSSFGSTV